MERSGPRQDVAWESVAGLTIGQLLRRTAATAGDREAVVFCDGDMRLSYRQFDDEVDRLARALLSLGLEAGDRFGVWATNVPQWVLLQFATARIGVVLVTINPAYRPQELEHALSLAEVRGLALIDHFKKSDYHATLRGLCPELANATPGELPSAKLPRLRWVVSLRGETPAGALSWQDLLARADRVDAAALREREAALDSEQPINIQFTSGTTGRPKGATLSHRNIVLNAHLSGVCQRLGGDDRICIPVPLYHCFGCVLGSLAAVAHGAAMVFPSESFEPGATLRAIERERCTALYGVPTMFIALFEHEDYPRLRHDSLRTGIMAGSPCPIELMRRVANELGAREITIGYGQTEASPIITQTRTDDSLELRVGTVGRALPGLEVRVVDPETRRPLPDGQAGELCARGHCVMLGYYRQPEKTAEAIDAEGWLYTGDLALREPNGYFRITGRLRDMIIRGGENIYPREIEERLHEHPAVANAQVVGVPDAKFGEAVLAWIMLREGRSATADELREFCRQGLAHFKAPQYIKFVDTFPMTVTGKVQKFRIRELAIEELGLQDVARIETA